MSAPVLVQLADLRPGQRVVDNLGGVWTRAERCVFDPDGNPIPPNEFTVAEEFYGPFTLKIRGGETPATQERES